MSRYIRRRPRPRADGGPKILQHLIPVRIVNGDVAVPMVKRKREVDARAAGFQTGKPRKLIT